MGTSNFFALRRIQIPPRGSFMISEIRACDFADTEVGRGISIEMIPGPNEPYCGALPRRRYDAEGGWW